MARTVPVTEEASALVRNSMPAAISVGSAARRRGYRSRFGEAPDSLNTLETIGVSVMPGQTTFTRISGASSKARALVRETRPPFDAAYAVEPGVVGTRAVPEATLTMLAWAAWRK